MENLTEKVSYLKGLSEGLAFACVLEHCRIDGRYRASLLEKRAQRGEKLLSFSYGDGNAKQLRGPHKSSFFLYFIQKEEFYP